MQRKLIKLIESLEFKQAIIATHSSEIIGDVPFNHVTVVQKRDRVSKPAVMANEIQAALKSMGSLHSIQLARVAYHGLIFFVEGDDKPFLTDIAYKMGPRKFDAFSAMAIQEIKGKGNWNYAIGAGKALAEASSGEIRTALLLDRDYMLESQVKEYHEKAYKEGLILKIWRRKEIENYFVCPIVMARFVSDRSERSISKDDMEALIQEAESELTEDLQLSFSDVIQSQTKPYITAKAAVKSAKNLIIERATGGDRIRDLVGGKEMISLLSRKCQAQYGVSFSPLNLCKFMQSDEMPIEVTDLIEALTQPKLMKVGA